MNSWPRQQRPAVVLLGHCSALLVLSPAQAIFPSPFSSTFTVPSFHYKQSHIVCTHKPFLQLFRLEHNKTHENFVWPFHEKWQHQSESVVLKKKKKKKAQSTICWKILLFDHFYNWWEWKRGDTKTGCESMGFMWSCTKFKPKLGGGEGQGRWGGTRQNHDVSEDLTNGSMKT